MPGLRVAVTSIVRRASPDERSGFLRIVDLDEGRVLERAPVRESAYRAIDPNPRGGYRGAKGLGVHGDRLVVANSERLFVLDSRWRIEREITDRLMGSVHDILCEEDGIWVTCTNCDVLLKVDWDGRPVGHWSWRYDRSLARDLGFRSVPPLREDLDYRDPRAAYGRVRSTVQLNALARTEEGLVLSFGRILAPRAVRRKRLYERLALAGARLGIVLRREPRVHAPLPAPPEPGSAYALVLLRQPAAAPVTPDATAEILYRREGVSVPNHNVVVTDRHLVYNDTDRGDLTALNRRTLLPERSVRVPGSPSFARGLARVGDSFLVGSNAPAALHRIDLERDAVIGSVVLSDDARESVYAIAVLPESFEDPPEGLEL